ncbi:protein NPGR2 isoform X2 [Asparagus officinalis]|uniref:protein NPGR2 isoform X2 n=1 Tax=Asparagus officinalis TaxID=4686 RepID=UPI00098E098A|nr:protein NPGR2 isoform X2 [Asparagus officinalis]
MNKRWMKGCGFDRSSPKEETMQCGERMVPSSDSLADKDCSIGGGSSQNCGGEQKIDMSNIEEAEYSLREGGCLNHEEARALLGRLEYQRGNLEAALRVFDGIDISAVAPKIKISISKKAARRKSHSHWDSPPMSIHAVSLLFEAMFLKSIALHDLGRFKEAAQSCSTILDIVESALPEGLPERFDINCKLQEILCKAAEFLPELWKMAGFYQEAILAYRRALLNNWNLEAETIAKMQKEFAIFLLYSGCDACPPNLRSQMNGSFTPRNNVEEAILLLMILLRKFALKRIKWDPSIIDHLTFALSISGQLRALASQVEELLPGVMERKEHYYTLALCYLGDGDDLTALNLLKKILSASEDPNCLKALLLAAKVCGEYDAFAEEGVSFSRRALSNLHGVCGQMESVANCLLGISLSSESRISVSDLEKDSRQREALEVLEKAEEVMQGKDSKTIYNLSLENAEQRKLEAALRYAKRFLKMEAQSSIKGWILLARILSAQKKFIDAETIVNAALDETVKWNQGELLRTKAKIQIAQGKLKNAIETYKDLLAVLQLKRKSSNIGIKSSKEEKEERSLEIGTWYDLANVYISTLQWKDAEDCITKLKAVCPYVASAWHATVSMFQGSCMKQRASTKKL